MLKNSVLIIAADQKKNYDFIQIRHDEDRYIYFDDFEFAVGYLIACQKNNLPEIILIDNNTTLINKFKQLCTECHINLNESKVINSDGKQIKLHSNFLGKNFKPEKRPH